MITSSNILKASILIVDDQMANISLLEEMLRGAGYESVTATTNPREVCNLHRKNHYSLILLDLQMPGMDGFQVMEGLKDVETDNYLPVLVQTAQPAHKLRALRAGAKDFVSKPFDVGEVLMRVHNMLEVRLLQFDAGVRAVEAEKSERGIRASELSYRRLFEAARDGIFILNVDTGRITDVNPFLVELLGFSHAQMVGRTVGELSPFKDIESNKVMLERLQKDGYVRYEDLPLETKNGRHVDVEFVCNVYPVGDKNVIQCNIRDITERKRAEQALRASEATMAAAQRIGHFGSWQLELANTTDVNANTLHWSDEMFRIAGYEPGAIEISNEWFFRLVPENEHQLIQDTVAAAIREHRPYSLVHGLIRPNGERRVVHESADVYFDEKTSQPLRMVGTAHDITERKRTEEALRESEEHFRFLNKLSLETRALADPASIMTVMTRMLGQHLGASRCAYADVENDGEQFTILHDYTDGCASTVGQYQLSLFGARAVATLNAGQTLIIRDVGAELLPAEGAEMFNAIGIQAIITCPLLKYGTLRAMMAVHQTTPRDWKAPEISTVQDVVERCWATIERGNAIEQLHQLNIVLEQRVTERTSQLQAVNQELEAFSYSVSHDLRAPLRHVLGFIDLLRQGAGPTLPPESLRHLATISQSAIRMGNLIDDLLAFSRIGRSEMQKTEVRLDPLVRDVVADFQKDTKGRNLAWEIHALPSVLADRALLRQVMVNLISNAVKFTGSRAEAKIEIGCAEGPDGETVIFVRDNGAGFDPRYIDKLFGVFQRLHDQDEFPGTGIGLANIKRIIHRHGGRAWAEGAVDRGATFYISLPAHSPTRSE